MKEQPYDLGYEVRRLISTYGDVEGTTRSGAIRDVLTEIAHLCRESGIDFDERVDAAAEVAHTEDEEEGEEC